MAGGNRKERRAAAKTANGSSKSTGAAFEPSNVIDEEGVNIILKHPDRAGPTGKTLFDLAEERQAELDKVNGRVRPRKSEDSTTPVEDEDLVGPLGNAILYSISLGVLHFTFDVMVYNQYREEIVWPEITRRAASAVPIFFIVVYLLHINAAKRFPLLRNLFFLAVSIASGCHMVYSANTHGYFYVMKTAPPIGALWVWSVIEMNLIYAAGSCVVVIGYLWWNGFDTF